MLILGPLPDKIGRKPLFVYGSLVMFVGAILSAFSWDFWSFLGFRIILAIGMGMTFITTGTIPTEFSVTKYRGLSFVFIFIFYTIGELIVIFVSFFYLESLSSGNWRALLFWTSFPVLLSYIFGHILLKESPRFLLLKGKNEESFKLIDELLKDNLK